jgi:hypothetical protein
MGWGSRKHGGDVGGGLDEFVGGFEEGEALHAVEVVAGKFSHIAGRQEGLQEGGVGVERGAGGGGEGFEKFFRGALGGGDGEVVRDELADDSGGAGGEVAGGEGGALGVDVAEGFAGFFERS